MLKVDYTDLVSVLDYDTSKLKYWMHISDPQKKYLDNI